jgi:hypothetical protein
VGEARDALGRLLACSATPCAGYRNGYRKRRAWRGRSSTTHDRNYRSSRSPVCLSTGRRTAESGSAGRGDPRCLGPFGLLLRDPLLALQRPPLDDSARPREGPVCGNFRHGAHEPDSRLWVDSPLPGDTANLGYRYSARRNASAILSVISRRSNSKAFGADTQTIPERRCIGDIGLSNHLLTLRRFIRAVRARRPPRPAARRSPCGRRPGCGSARRR